MGLRLDHKIIGILFTISIFAFGVTASAAPAPTLFAYNDTSKQCGTFRDGDERVSYKLPDNWKTYDYDKTISKTTQQYCDELGYTNVGNIVVFLDLSANRLITPDEQSIKNNFNFPLLVAIIVFFVIIASIIVTIKVKKSSNRNIKPTE